MKPQSCSAQKLVFLAIGGNLPHERWGHPRITLNKALEELTKKGVTVSARSRWYRTAPFPCMEQPWYTNAVVCLKTYLQPVSLMHLLHEIESVFGRIRTVANAARTIDLDLLDYNGLVLAGLGSLILPHPRMADRAFVLLPLAEIAPFWVHPVSKQPLASLISSMPPGQEVALEDDQDSTGHD